MTSPSSSRRTIAVLVLAAVLLAPLAAVAAPRAAVPANRVVASAVGDLLARFWSSLTALWPDGGCSVDPSGRCDPHRAVQPPVTPDGGCSLDPNGGCAGGS